MEEMATDRRGDVGEHGERLLGLRKASCDSHLVKILGSGLDNCRWQLDGGGRENSEGAENMGTDGEDNGIGGRLLTGLRGVLQCGGAVSSSIRVRDAGAYLPHGKGHEKFPAQGHQEDYREAAKLMVGWELAVTTAGDRDREIRG